MVVISELAWCFNLKNEDLGRQSTSFSDIYVCVCVCVCVYMYVYIYYIYIEKVLHCFH